MNRTYDPYGDIRAAGPGAILGAAQMPEQAMNRVTAAEPGISRAMNELMQSIAALDAELSNLRNRLEPVRCPIPREVEKEARISGGPGGSALCAGIFSATQQIHALRMAAATTTQELEI